ncbi:MAG: 2,3-bisphosphoglycerate-independent phosphoglycerate mutase [Rickettsiales bacterium]|nr:2,3-bisphosphoglycerate-independent phosphoglycerate mutase [Rickettsiales bacterium]
MFNNGPIALCVLDGWGIADASDSNAIKNANPNCFNFLNKQFPSTSLIASGKDVGLPEGQMGNSEVGHMTMGSGRVILQDLVRINSSLNSVLQKDVIQNVITKLRQTNKQCHLIALVSDGGVHSHINHLIIIAKYLLAQKIGVKLHLITDGRDSDPNSGIKFVKKLNELANNNPLLSICTITGRYFAMDRDKNFDRTEKAFRAIMHGIGKKFSDPVEAILSSYETKITDEFIEPLVFNQYKAIENGDAIIFCNFRTDRIRQLCTAILDPSFTEFNRGEEIHISKAFTLVSYSKELEKFAEPLFRREVHKNTLSEVLNQQNLSSLRIAETEKYAHITFFFDVGRENSYPNEKRILIPSPKVATYNQKPAMSAHSITDILVSELTQNKYDFVLLNYANPDMVGHTGDYSATVEAIKVVDACLQKLYHAIVEEMKGTLILVGDHGNAECMVTKKSNTICTAHTTNPVPFIIANQTLKNNPEIKLKGGSLADVAPTILNLFGLTKPKEMSGQNLLEYKMSYA